MSFHEILELLPAPPGTTLVVMKVPRNMEPTKIAQMMRSLKEQTGHVFLPVYEEADLNELFKFHSDEELADLYGLQRIQK